MNGWPDALAETFLCGVPVTAYVEAPSTEPIERVIPGIKDLNLKNTYVSDKPVSVKEHIQNWRDRCIEVADSLDPTYDVSNNFLPQTTVENGWTIHTYFCQGRVLGWLAMKLIKEGFFHLELYNASTSLTPDKVLVLGQSTKRSRNQIGYFGEGAKVEINRLLYCGASVVYFTNNSRWIFYYDAHYVLHANIQAYETPAHVTRIQVNNIPISAYNPSDYLFIYPANQKCVSANNMDDMSRLKGMEVLFDSHCHGNIYVHGILVCRLGDYKVTQFGLNYIGACNMSLLGIGRDRDSITVGALTALLPDVFAETRMKGNEAVYKHLCKVFYQEIPKIKIDTFAFSVKGVQCYSYVRRSSSSSSSTSSEKSPLSVMASGLLSYFFFLHGPQSIPFEGVTSAVRTEADLFQYKAIAVPDALFPWLHASEDCPTFESLWRQNCEQVLSLPEYVFDEVLPTEYTCEICSLETPELVEFAKSFRRVISEYFEDPKFGRMLRFKNFGAITKKNLRRFIPIKVPPSSQVNYFILDTMLLSADLVHQEYLTKDPTFKCDGNCGCVMNVIIDDILKSVSESDRSRLDARFRRKHLNSMATNLRTAPSSAAPPPRSPSPPQVAAAQTPHHYDDISHDDDDNNTLTKDEVVIGGREDFTKIQTVVTKVTLVEPEKGALKGLHEHMNDTARKCCEQYCMNAEDLRASFRPSDGMDGHKNSPTIVQKCCEVEPSAFYERLTQKTSLGISIFVDKGDFHASMAKLSAEQDTSLLALQYIICILSPVVKCATTKCHIVVEDCGTMAFNYNGDLFFNLYAMSSLYEQGPRYTLQFWFVTFCHELTHNQEKDHDEDFARVFGYVMRYHLNAYHQLLSLLHGVCGEVVSWDTFVAFCHQYPPR